MKSIIKKLIRSLWRILAPVHRPLIRKFDQHAMRLLRELPPPPPASAHDLDLVLNSLVRELARLQLQVEILRHQIDSLETIDAGQSRHENRLSVVGETG
jgi:hypothetical protein